MRAEIAAMRTGSGPRAIVNVASSAGTTAAPGMSAYAAAKHAVIGLTRVSAVDGMEGDLVTLSDVFVFEGGELQPTGVRPKLAERLQDAGITLPGDLFGTT